MDSRCPSEPRPVSPATLLLLFACACAGIQCQENLPPVVQPQEVLVGGISLRVGANGYVILTAENVPVGTDGAVNIRVTNLYDEVVSDSEDVRIEAVIYQSSHPGRRDTIRAGREAIQNPSMLISYLLAIPPNKSLELMTPWSNTFAGDSAFALVADKDTVFWEKGVEVTAYKVEFTLSARVKLFKKRQMLTIGEQPFTVYYRWSRAGSG